jgi:catechol 2,3-dioxygenase-like lactoylglutathione lyase family enzyme
MEKPNPGRWFPHFVIAVLAFALGTAAGRQETAGATRAFARDPAPDRVTGIGGLFFRSADPETTLDWYRRHLGIDAADWGGFAFQWQEKDRPGEIGYTVWAAFPSSTEYFAPSKESFMVNFRVVDLTTLIAALEDEGVEIVGEIEEHPNGKFAWVLDPEGRKIELWEPVSASEDPYLE